MRKVRGNTGLSFLMFSKNLEKSHKMYLRGSNLQDVIGL